MKKKESIAIVPGGFEEASLNHVNIDRVWIKKRKGFIKYALQFGYSLTPAYVFGERGTFSNVQGLWAIRHWLNQFGIPAVLPFGKWWCPILPREVQLNIIVGSPLSIPQIPNPSNEDVDKYHKLYIQHLVDLYDRHKDKYYHKNSGELEIW